MACFTVFYWLFVLGLQATLETPSAVSADFLKIPAVIPEERSMFNLSTSDTSIQPSASERPTYLSVSSTPLLSSPYPSLPSQSAGTPSKTSPTLSTPGQTVMTTKLTPSSLTAAESLTSSTLLTSPSPPTSSKPQPKTVPLPTIDPSSADNQTTDDVVDTFPTDPPSSTTSLSRRLTTPTLPTDSTLKTTTTTRIPSTTKTSTRGIPPTQSTTTRLTPPPFTTNSTNKMPTTTFKPATPPIPPILPTPKKPPTPPTIWTTTTTAPLPPHERFCNFTFSEEYETRCMECEKMGTGDVCKPGEHRAMDFAGTCTLSSRSTRRQRRRRRPHWAWREKPSRWVSRLRRGCKARCLKVIQIPACCQGFWGDNCDECPGGASNQCNGNGVCMKDGTCSCDSGFRGTACEICEGKTNGSRCSIECGCVHGKCIFLSGMKRTVCLCHSGFRGRKCDQPVAGCRDLNCESPGVCRETSGGAACICPLGYKHNKVDGTCAAENPCLGQYPMCGHGNTECQQTGPGLYQCVCAQNYTGDGIVCIPIDPCQTNRGGCPQDKDCRFTGPNMHKCVCPLGYTASDADGNCTLKDVCKPLSCHPKATCETIGPHRISCQCLDGYTGNGTMCYGSIIERLIDLNTKSRPLRNNLEYSIRYLSKYYLEELTQHGPFTIFVPTDRAFRSVRKSSGGFSKFLENKDRALQIMRQHILIGKFQLEDLQVYDKFYTLQGNPALLQVKVSRDIFKYKLDGTRGKGKVKIRNLEASNGMIHIVNSLLTMSPEIEGDPQGTALDLMKQTTRHYSTTVSLIKIIGLEEKFSAPNTTVFGVVDDAWKSLPKGAIHYLSTDPEGRLKLRSILLNHVALGAVGITHLINLDSIRTLDNYRVNISVSNLGQVRLENQSSITQANIVVRTGFIHRVDKLIVPSYMDVVYPNSCPEIQSRDVQGRCMPCDLRKCPRPTDIMTTRYSRRCVRSILTSTPYCKAVCRRETKIRQCCPGFYGRACLPCPSGFRSPCSGRGQCDAGILGSGRCKCEAGYAGSACQMCRETDKYGPTCTATCTCLHGLCNDGPDGDGLCRKNTCQPGYISENCDRKVMACGPRTVTCHAHSFCYVGHDNIYRCKCNPGYEGDGEDCLELDPCEQKVNGGCHQQATCIKLTPTMLKCECNTGWVGDGTFCSPRSPCYEGCHENATCLNIDSEFHCVCDVGFSGNGTWCETDNVCLENNGGCDPKAYCSPLKPGLASGENRTCQCPPDMSGDGSVCHGTIAEQVMAHPNLTRLASLIKTIELDDLLLAQESEDFTFFAPSDAAMDEFLSSLKARQSAGGWHSMYFLLEFLNFHSIDSAYSLEALKSYSGILQSYPTLYDGFSLYTVNINSSLKIVVNHSKFANFVVNDILTTNGLIHIIDKVLEPFLPDANKPSVEDSLRENPEYSKFYNLLQSTGVLPELSEMDEFTLFVPTNDAFGPIHQRLSANALRYYIVPSLVFTPSVYNRQRLETLLGPRHQLEINLFDNLVLVNKQQVTMPDVLVDGGVLHQLDKLLHPVLNWCNATDIVVDEGPCVDCSLNVTDLPCPYDMSPFVPARIRHFHCRYPSPLGGPDMVGCQQICGLVPTKSTCCAGYFGQHCEECPGGAEFPCSRRGTCFDGSTGNGTCMCDSGFSGLDCSQCENPSMALPNCNTTHPTCKTGESGCHEHAACKVNPLGPAHCTCKTGYHGNGQWCRENVNGCLTEQYGGCDRSMRASCHYQPPDVTELQDNKPVCQCQAGYEGNGTLCSQDMLDLVSRLPALTYFRSKMDQVDVTNITKLMQSLTQNITLFAPLSENYAALKLSDLIVQGQNLWLPENLTSTEAVGQAEEGIAPSQLLQINEVTALGGQEINITAGESGQLYANNVPIVERNIVTQNGLLHLTESPISSFSAVQVSPSHSRGKSNSTVVAVCVVVIIVAIIIVLVVAVLLVKSRKKGGFKLFNRSRSTEGSDTSVSFARLNAHDEDDASLKGSDAPKYDNPIFDDPDIM